MGRLKEVFYGEFNDLDRALQKPESVKKLYIQFPDNLNNYGTEFAKFTRLQVLDIHTGITHVPYLPKQIGDLKSLKSLSILNVSFTEFPDWISGLTNLEYLRVRGCEITEILSGIKNLQKLKALKIENCDITTLPPQFEEMDSITYLSLNDNKKIKGLLLEHLPPNLTQLDLFSQAIDADELSKIKNYIPKLKIALHY